MKHIKTIIIAFFIGCVVSFVIFYSPNKPPPTITPATVTTPENVTVKPSEPGRPIIKYIPVESKVDLTPLYAEIEQLRAEKQQLLEWGLEGWNTNVNPEPPPVVADRPLPVPAVKRAGFGLWPGVAASLNYKDGNLAPSGYLTLQMFYLYRFTCGAQVNIKEAGVNLGYHLPPFRNLQIRALVNKEFSGSSWPDNYGLGVGLNF